MFFIYQFPSNDMLIRELHTHLCPHCNNDGSGAPRSGSHDHVDSNDRGDSIERVGRFVPAGLDQRTANW